LQHIYDITRVETTQPSYLTIGVFDGVHRGHQYLISQLVQKARENACQTAVLTLFPHPDVVLRGQSGRYYLTTPEQKAKLLVSLGIDLVVTHPFDDRVRTMRASAFVDLLITHLNMRSLWVTNDFAMGYKREGNFTFLQAQSQERGFELVSINLLQSEKSSEVISSSRIRTALAEGNVKQAADWLGRPYGVDGVVIHGDHRGRTIGFPTANLNVWSEQIIPANGVYACIATIDKERFKAVTNVGVRPTFEGEGLRIEAHLLDFDRDIYGKTVTLEFIARLRGEQRFPGIDALVAQIRTDTEQGRQLLETWAAQQGIHAQNT
jgi:riboflavin kinase/FMN adenylyltransferase